jgi:hypothetical protein
VSKEWRARRTRLSATNGARCGIGAIITVNAYNKPICGFQYDHLCDDENKKMSNGLHDTYNTPKQQQ